jgi:hypothetical protein
MLRQCNFFFYRHQNSNAECRDAPITDRLRLLLALAQQHDRALQHHHILLIICEVFSLAVLLDLYRPLCCIHCRLKVSLDLAHKCDVQEASLNQHH